MDVLGCSAVKAANRQELLALAQHKRLIGLDVLQRGQLHMAHIHPARRCHAHGQLLGLGQERVFHRGQLGDDVHALGILRPGHVATALLHQGEFGLHPGQGSSLGQRYRRHRHLQRVIALGHHLGHALAVKRRLLHIHGPRQVRAAHAQQPEVIALVHLANQLQMAAKGPLGQQVLEKRGQALPCPVEKRLAVVLSHKRRALYGVVHQCVLRQHRRVVIGPEPFVGNEASDRPTARAVLEQPTNQALLGAQKHIKSAVPHGESLSWVEGGSDLLVALVVFAELSGQTQAPLYIAQH